MIITKESPPSSVINLSKGAISRYNLGLPPLAQKLESCDLGDSGRVLNRLDNPTVVFFLLKEF